jgi:hypothetical protein
VARTVTRCVVGLLCALLVAWMLLAAAAAVATARQPVKESRTISLHADNMGAHL